MKKCILSYILSTILITNFSFTSATKHSQKPSNTPPLPHAESHTESAGKPRLGKGPPKVPTYKDILNSAYITAFKNKYPSRIAPPKHEHKHKSKKRKSSPAVSPSWNERDLDQIFRSSIIEPSRVICRCKNEYNHDAYSSFKIFYTRWATFQDYFQKLVESVNNIKYFSEESKQATQAVNETIREFMTPSEYLNEVEKMLFAGTTFDSQVVSEIISKKLSELGFENYIIQFTPTYKKHSDTTDYYDDIKWAVLYRNYKNEWYIIDFSYAMEHKFDTSTPIIYTAISPFFKYAQPLINLAGTRNLQWSLTFHRKIFNNAVIINFMPGFYEKSDDYYLADIEYLPFDFFVACKFAIEQKYDIEQYITEMKLWMDYLQLLPNYKVLTPPPEITVEMCEYMENYLVFPE